MQNLIHPDTQKEIIRIIAKIVKLIKKEICKENKKDELLGNSNRSDSSSNNSSTH
jgi:hypothetical protein